MKGREKDMDSCRTCCNGGNEGVLYLEFVPHSIWYGILMSLERWCLTLESRRGKWLGKV